MAEEAKVFAEDLGARFGFRPQARARHSTAAAPHARQRAPTRGLPQVISIRGGRTLSPSLVTLLGALTNVLLSALKLVVGTMSGSASLVADAYHSCSDLLVDAVTMAAVHAPPSSRRDERAPLYEG